MVEHIWDSMPTPTPSHVHPEQLIVYWDNTMCDQFRCLDNYFPDSTTHWPNVGPAL